MKGPSSGQFAASDGPRTDHKNLAGTGASLQTSWDGGDVKQRTELRKEPLVSLHPASCPGLTELHLESAELKQMSGHGVGTVLPLSLQGSLIPSSWNQLQMLSVRPGGCTVPFLGFA
jgi:hypothetical protein